MENQESIFLIHSDAFKRFLSSCDLKNFDFIDIDSFQAVSTVHDPLNAAIQHLSTLFEQTTAATIVEWSSVLSPLFPPTITGWLLEYSQIYTRDAEIDWNETSLLSSECEVCVVQVYLFSKYCFSMKR